MVLDKSSLVDRAVSAYATLLDDSGSLVLADPPVQSQLVRQAGAIARRLLAVNGEETAATSFDRSTRLGEQRARSGIHPTQSLRAASLMFEALFPLLVSTLGARPSPEQIVELGTALEHEIQQRLAVGSIPYVDYLLTKLLSAQQDERSRIARDLHDRIAHGMGAALQQLELFDHYRDRDPERAEKHLATARDAIRVSFDGTRQVSADLWARMGDVTLGAALESYAASSISEGTTANVFVVGEDPGLPDEVNQELYLLLREALRNAVVHAAPTMIDIELTTADDMFRAVVHDNGSGFDVTTAKTVGGLASISERAELIGGRASITSTGSGTIVDVRVPLPHRIGWP